MAEYIKEMVYSADRITAERIARGTYKGLDYYVINLGTHPCAYIDVTNTLLNGKDYDDIDIRCHGGLTYSRNNLLTVDKRGWFIGWDYAHCEDFVAHKIMYQSNLYSGGKHWITEEIVNECKDVIDQIIEQEEAKKMTDNDIKKALECCNGWDGRCLNCPLNCEWTNCKEKLNSYTLDLINRQKAEIDRLQKTVVDLNANLSESINRFTLLETLYKIKCKELRDYKIRTIKEFVERLKEKATSTFYEEHKYVDTVDIDNLVKEMSGV